MTQCNSMAYLSGHIRQPSDHLTHAKQSRSSQGRSQCRPTWSLQIFCLIMVAVICNLLNEAATVESRHTVQARGKFHGQEEVSHTITQIRKAGFEVRIYRVQVMEGSGPYINLYRIINPLADKKTLNKYPVIYGHGLLFNSFSMISKNEHARPRKPKIGEPTILNENGDEPNDYCFPFALSNNNFDVWLYDARASSSYMSDLKHLRDYEKAEKFWNFTLDTEALEDLPMVMNFVMEKTRSEKIVYVGFSESTMFMFALLSTRPEIAEKLAVYVAFAPVTYMAYTRGLELAILVPPSVLTPRNFNYLSGSTVELMNNIITNLCSSNNNVERYACGKLMDSLGANGETEKDKEFLDHIYKLTSLSSIRQFVQFLFRDRFSMYDWGRKKNMQLYGEPNPPNYNLTKIKLDRMIFARGGQDKLATPEGQRRMLSELGSKPYLDLLVKEYGHFSFVDGKDLIMKTNEPVMRGIYALLYKQVNGTMTADFTFSYEPEDLKTVITT